MEQRIRFCTASDGARIAYATMGGGPPLVKAANWLSHLEFDLRSPVWRPWLRELSRDHLFVRYDERGCGLSDREVPEFGFEAWVRDLEAVVDALELERFALLVRGFLGVAEEGRVPAAPDHGRAGAPSDARAAAPDGGTAAVAGAPASRDAPAADARSAAPSGAPPRPGEPEAGNGGSLLQRLRRRKLGQWGLAYTAAAWLGLQLLSVVADPWSLSAGAVRGIQALLAAGLPVTLVLAWYHGERGRQRVSGAELLILALLLGIAGAMVALVAG